jgi:predicted ATP-grasp superfamily ATP-dependent carboligase
MDDKQAGVSARLSDDRRPSRWAGRGGACGQQEWRADRDVPVIVVGAGLSALGAIRLLGRAGIPAYCYGAAQIEARSRWYRPAPGCDTVSARPERLASYLLQAPFETAVLLPASDAAVRAIATLPESLVWRFPASVSPIKVAEQITDKARFAEALERLAEPGPRTWRIDGVSDIAALAEADLEGAFLKPVDSASYMAAFGVKGTRVASREDAMAKAERALSEGHRMVLQEYIPSIDSSGRRGDHVLIDGFIDRHGNMTAMFARRRQRMFPLDFGNTSAMISIPIEEVAGAAQSLARIATGLGCRGIVSGEFKQDPRDGVYKLLEINSRVWWFVEYAGRCGVDLCTMSYRDALGEEIEPIGTYKVGAKFFHAYYDYHALRALHREGRFGWAQVASWIGAQEPTFNWSDPLPAIADAAQRLRPRRQTAVEKPRTA